MKHTFFVVAYVLLMGGVIVALDVLFLRDHFWARLMTNIGIVVIFVALYLFVFQRVFR